MEHFQEQLLKCKDARMGIVNEVLNSMRVIKYYAWEGKFTNKVSVLWCGCPQFLSCFVARNIIYDIVLIYFIAVRTLLQINMARRAELGRLRAYAVTDALLFTFWEIVPAVVGATAFILHTYYLGKRVHRCVV